MRTFKFMFLLSVFTLPFFSAHADKVYFDLSNTTLNNITATTNGDGSVTFALTDPASNGTVRFNDVSDFTTVNSVAFKYSQTAGTGGKVVYAIWNQYMSNTRKSYIPYSSLMGGSSFDIQAIIAEGSSVNSAYFGIQIKAGEGYGVTISEVYYKYNIAAVDGVLINTLDYYNAGDTSAKTSVSSTISISGNTIPVNFVGVTTPSADKYVDLSEYKGVSFELDYPEALEGAVDEIRVRFTFVNGDETSTENIFLSSNVTGSGVYMFNFENYAIPSKKLSAIKVMKATNTVYTEAFSIIASNVYALNVGEVSDISSQIKDDYNEVGNIYSLQGILIKENVKLSDVIDSLGSGLYIFNGKKIQVK